MIDILENHLKQNVPTPLYDLYMAVFEITEQLGSDADEYFSNLFMMYGSGLVDDINQDIHNAVMNEVYDVLSAHGIGVSLDADLSKIEPILRFLVMIEDTEFTDEVMAIVENDLMDHGEKVAQCIEQVVGVPVEETLPILIDVPETVILSIKRYMEQRISTQPKEDDYSAPVQADYIKQLAQYVKIVQGSEMRCYQHAQIDGVELGLPIQYYWSLYREYLTSIPMEAMIYELIGFCLISDSHEKNPTETIGPIIESYYGSDIDKLTQANILITNTLINLRNSAKSGMFHEPGQS